jgi:hypothetical protein
MSVFFAALEQAEQDRARRRSAAPSHSASELSPIGSAEDRNGLEQLKLLCAYSKFDIGLYTTVATIFAAAIAFEPAVFKFHRGLLSVAVVLTCLAGMAAGVIASRCAHFTSWSALWRTKIGPFRWRGLTGEHWAYLQHSCFGIALVAAVLSVLSRYVNWQLVMACIP